MTFDPYNLLPLISLNRVRFVDTPGLTDDVRGKAAYELLSQHVLAGQIIAAFPDLQQADDVLLAFDQRYLAQSNPVAEALAAKFGQRLGWLLLTLKRGDPANRAARPEWDESVWAHWAGTERVILGGGLVSGHLGQAMARQAQTVVAGLYNLEIAQFPAALPLIGLARKTTADARRALVFDFGQTATKRACAIYVGGSLTALECLTPLPAPKDVEGAALLRGMVDRVVETWRTVQRDDLSRRIHLALASYVVDGQPMTQGMYGTLRALSPDVAGLLSAEISQGGGTDIILDLTHDGTAAALAYAGSAQTAVIMMGTALGVGFAPPADGLRPLGDLRVA